MTTTAQPRWPDDIHQVFGELAVRQVSYVPDAGHSRLIRACQDDPTITAVSLTTEEEGIALAAGAWLGGQRSALLMQSSGVGNCPNLLAMARSCSFPLLIVVTMRGQWGEANPWQVPMGQTTAALLQLYGVVTFAVDDATGVADTVRAAGTMAWSGNAVAAVLISQALIGAKQFAAAHR